MVYIGVEVVAPPLQELLNLKLQHCSIAAVLSGTTDYLEHVVRAVSTIWL